MNLHLLTIHTRQGHIIVISPGVQMQSSRFIAITSFCRSLTTYPILNYLINIGPVRYFAASHQLQDFFVLSLCQLSRLLSLSSFYTVMKMGKMGIHKTCQIITNLKEEGVIVILKQTCRSRYSPL